MLFAEIIREAGLSPNEYPTASRIPVELYDGKDRKVTSKSAVYVNPLFCNNPKAKLAFTEAVQDLEEAPFETVSLSVRIDENMVVLNYQTPNSKRFSRLPALDPLDYMD